MGQAALLAAVLAAAAALGGGGVAAAAAATAAAPASIRMAAAAATTEAGPMIVITEEPWGPEAAEAMQCEPPSSTEADGRLEVKCTGKASEVLLVRNYEEWMQKLEQISTRRADDAPQEQEASTLVAIGSGAIGALGEALDKGFLRGIRTVVAVSPMPSQADTDWCDKQKYNRDVTIVCLIFELEEAIFTAAAGAALIPWTRKRFALLTDRAESDPLSNFIFRAFAHGVAYVDPTVSVSLLRITSKAAPGSEQRLLAVQAEIERLTDLEPVVYLDLQDADSVKKALQAVQATHSARRIHAGTVSYAILPPTFTGFDPSGDALPEWGQAVLNAVALDVVRMLLEVPKERRGFKGECWSTKKLCFLGHADQWVSTTWTRQDLPNSRFLPQKIGDLQKRPSILRLAQRPCGNATTADYLKQEIVSAMHSGSDAHDDNLPCNVSLQCCSPVAPAALSRLYQLPKLDCSADKCTEGIQAMQDQVCEGGTFMAHNCPTPDTSRSHGVRLIGIGITVRNVANIDISSGMFYVDLNIYLYEQNERVSLEDVQAGRVPQECDFHDTGLGHIMTIKTAADFNRAFAVVGTDRFLAIEPELLSDHAYVHFKGNLFFRPHLNTWPFDEQRLVISIDSALAEPVHFCVLRDFTALLPGIRLPGIQPSELFKVLSFETEVKRVCWPPYKHPERNKCRKWKNDQFFESGARRNRRECVRCEEEDPELAGATNDVTCRCMGGSGPTGRASFTVVFKRPLGRLALSVFGPPLMIITLNQAVFFMYVEASETRLSMCASALLSSVMYHVTIMANTPSTAEETTKADTFMMLCYACNAGVWLIALVQYMAVYGKNAPMTVAWAKESMWYKTRIGGPTTSVALVACTIMVEGPRGALFLFLLSLVGTAVFLRWDYQRFAQTWEARGGTRTTAPAGWGEEAASGSGAGAEAGGKAGGGGGGGSEGVEIELTTRMRRSSARAIDPFVLEERRETPS